MLRFLRYYWEDIRLFCFEIVFLVLDGFRIGW